MTGDQANEKKGKNKNHCWETTLAIHDPKNNNNNNSQGNHEDHDQLMALGRMAESPCPRTVTDGSLSPVEADCSNNHEPPTEAKKDFEDDERKKLQKVAETEGCNTSGRSNEACGISSRHEKMGRTIVNAGSFEKLASSSVPLKDDSKYQPSSSMENRNAVEDEDSNESAANADEAYLEPVEQLPPTIRDHPKRRRIPTQRFMPDAESLTKKRRLPEVRESQAKKEKVLPQRRGNHQVSTIMSTTQMCYKASELLNGIESSQARIRCTSFQQLEEFRKKFLEDSREHMAFWGEFLELAGVQRMLLVIHKFVSDSHSVIASCVNLGFCCEYLSDVASGKIVERRGLDILVHLCEIYGKKMNHQTSSNRIKIPQTSGSSNQDAICIDDGSDYEDNDSTIDEVFEPLRVISAVWEAFHGMVLRQSPPETSHQKRLIEAALKTFHILIPMPIEQKSIDFVSYIIGRVFATLTLLMKNSSSAKSFGANSILKWFRVLKTQSGEWRPDGLGKFCNDVSLFVRTCSSKGMALGDNERNEWNLFFIHHIPKSRCQEELLLTLCTITDEGSIVQTKGLVQALVSAIESDELSPDTKVLGQNLLKKLL